MQALFRKPAPTQTRLLACRAAPRVFTDSEWDTAVETAGKLLESLQGADAVEAEVDTDAGTIELGGKTFSEKQWTDAMEKAPLLLKEMERIQAVAAGEQPEGAEGVGTGEALSGAEDSSSERLFTPEQWEAAIKIAVAAEEALAKKAEIDENLNAMKLEAESLVPPPTGPTVSDVMAFSGTAPEIVNGRLAMLGFVSAAAMELTTGKSVAAQFSDESVPVILTVALFIVASLIPMFKGADERSVGPFNSNAEKLNGRVAMIAMAALLILEASRQGTPLL